MTVKTFRGLMADGAQDTINLHTNDGKTGYRIVKFQLFPQNPAEANAESVVKIYKVDQKITGANPTTSTADFSDQTLVAIAAMGNSTAGNVYPPTLTVVFDNEIFNQDIYLTHKETTGSEEVNYYIELEQVTLDLSQATVATLQSIRSNATGTVVLP